MNADSEVKKKRKWVMGMPHLLFPLLLIGKAWRCEHSAGAALLDESFIYVILDSQCNVCFSSALIRLSSNKSTKAVKRL